jgi:riboflavin biosynthesis pyrimidine reductase
MRALLPEPGEPVDVHDWYARDWLEPGGVRVNFIASADGAISVAGRSGGLQTPGDNTVFAALRDLADVVVAGSGTVLAEGYGPSRPSPERRGLRRARGLAEVPPIAVVSRSLRLNPAAELFTAAEARTLVLTCAAADPDAKRALAAHADVVDCGDEDVDPAAARAALADRGHRRVLCEGGPTLFADWGAAGAVDELCLTTSPLLAGPGAGRVVAGRPWLAPLGLRLAGLLEEDGALFSRYRVGPS